MPKSVTFEPGIQYVLHGIGYEVRKILSDGTAIVKNLKTQKLHSQPLPALWTYWEENTLEFVIDGENLRHIPGVAFPTTYEFADFKSIPKALRTETWHRYLLIQPSLSLPSSQRTIESIEQRIVAFYTSSEEAQKRGGQPISLGLHVGTKKKPRKDTREQKQPTSAGKKSPPEKPVQKAKGKLRTKHHPQLPPSAPTPRTVQRWIARFEKGHDIRSLIPSYYRRGRKERSMAPAVEELVNEAINLVYLDDMRAPVSKVVEEVQTLVLKANLSKRPQEKLKCPSRSSVYRYVAGLDPEEVDIERLGLALARLKHDQTERGPQPTRPNQRQEFDFSQLNAMVIDDEDHLPIGRPTIAAIRDKYTGYISGIYITFDPPSYRTVMECMLYAFLRKHHVKSFFQTKNEYLAYGIPEVLVVDNGIELDQQLKLACLQLGIELQQMPKRMPWFKGSLERWFRTVDQELLHSLPGKTFSNFLERGDYDPQKDACMTLSGLWEILHLWIVDDYTQNKHRGVGGKPDTLGVPAKLWQRALEQDFVPRLPPSRNDLLVLISQTTTRVPQRYGIEFENITYQNPALKALRNALLQEKKARRNGLSREEEELGTVTVKFYPGDLSRIWVLDPLTHQYLEVEAEDQEYTQGLSLHKHRVIKRYVKEELQRDIDEEALILAKARIQERIRKEFPRARKAHTRTGGARWLDIQVMTWMRTESATSIVEAEPVLSKVEEASPPSASTPLAALPRMIPPRPVEESSGLPPELHEIGMVLPERIPGVSLLSQEGDKTETPALTPLLEPVQAPPSQRRKPKNARKGEDDQQKKEQQESQPSQGATEQVGETSPDPFAKFAITSSYIKPR